MTDGIDREVDASVIVPVYNDRRLADLLAALAAQDAPGVAFEVVVVDNASDAVDVSDTCAPYGFVRVVREERPGSYAARNAGLRHARGRWLGFVDSDCVPAPDWVARGVAALAVGEPLAWLAGRVELAVGDPPTLAELHELVFAFDQEGSVARDGFGRTANLWTTRATMDAAGPFDDRLMSGGDLEWCRRATRAGATGRYAPEVRVVHPARASLDQHVTKLLRVTRGELDLRPGLADRLVYIAKRIAPPRRLLSARHRSRLSSSDVLRVAWLAIWTRWYTLARALAGGGRARGM